jgi:ferrous iron transport protein B
MKTLDSALSTQHSALTVVLVGNPNTGKTTLFNALAGMRQHVGNYPGVTVETKKGHLRVGERSFDLVDLPGTYSLAPRSPDEMVAVDLILGQQPGEARPNVVLSIVDASNLERNLYLTTQVLELGLPVVLALNMVDVAERHGLRIDAGRLSKQLGCRVVPIQANKNKGLAELKTALVEAAADPTPIRGPVFPDAFETEVVTLREALNNATPPFLARRLLLDVGGYTETRLSAQHPNLNALLREARQRLAEAACPVPAIEARTRYAWIRETTAGCIERPAKRPVTWTDRIDRVLTHRLWGSLVFFLLMFLVFQSIFTWAKPLMDLIDKGREEVSTLVRLSMAPGPLRGLLADGILRGVGSVVVFLPQIIILFTFIAILEDCGYMARAAFLMDRIMARCGLSGKSFIPMLSSVACAVPGIMATRVIENRRDRLATILTAPLMSCSARLPVYTLLIGAFLTTGYGWWMPGLVMFCMYTLGIVLAPLVALLLKRTLLRGETPVFVMEMPVYKVPSLRTVFRRVTDSAWAFLRRAGTLILATMIIVWALLYFPASMPAGQSYFQVVGTKDDQWQKEYASADKELDKVKEELEKASEDEKPALEERKQTLEEQLKPGDDLKDEVNKLRAEWTEQSLLGHAGHAIEPLVRPLGWDWKIGVAALASFPAREVVVGTLGILYQTGEGVKDDVEKDKTDNQLSQALRAAGYTVPVALSLMVFFALCCQCASTLVIIRRETNSWRWPAFTFVYMTVLAYVGALIVYQVGSRIG